MATAKDGEAIKRRKLKILIFIIIIIVIIITSWHLHEYFVYREFEIETEIHELTRRLFADEQKNFHYLVKINYQHNTTVHHYNDLSPEPLLKLHEDLLDNNNNTNSTIYLMRRLFDNYELNTFIAENYTDEEKQEENDFLNAIMETKTMQHTMKFLEHKGYISSDTKSQKQLLYDLWFQQFSRGENDVISSSGFEHVFLAEIKDQNVLGLQNWIYFHEQEKAGKLNYKGYIEKIDLGKDDQHLLAVRFSFHKLQKQYSSLFVGSSPELELSLYTVCFMMSLNEDCPIHLGSSKFSIITHSWQSCGKSGLSAAYPTIFYESTITTTSRPKKRKKYIIAKNWKPQPCMPSASKQGQPRRYHSFKFLFCLES